jgi:hypothetical protein
MAVLAGFVNSGAAGLSFYRIVRWFLKKQFAPAIHRKYKQIDNFNFNSTKFAGIFN